MENEQQVHLYDSAPAHLLVVVKCFLAKNSVTILEHSPYSPDLALSDFYLLTEISVEGRCFFDGLTSLGM
jgi:hypothetical protein